MITYTYLVPTSRLWGGGIYHCCRNVRYTQNRLKHLSLVDALICACFKRQDDTTKTVTYHATSTIYFYFIYPTVYMYLYIWHKSHSTHVVPGTQKNTFSIIVDTCADPESFVRLGSNSDKFLIRGNKIQIALKVGHHRPASEMPLKWCYTGGPMMAQH